MPENRVRLQTFLVVLTCLCFTLPLRSQNAAPNDRNAVNTSARPGDMMADSPVQFPKEGALPSRFPPDVKEQGEPAEKDYYIFSSPCRSLEQITLIQQAMPPGHFTPPPSDWKYLPRTRKILTEGGELRILALGDSIINDTMRSGWVAKLQEAYPKARIQTTVYVRGGGGCQHYREEDRIAKYVLPRKPDLMIIGGISEKNVESIREVIHQLRDGLREVEILLTSGTFGTTDPRDAATLARAPHSGTGAYGQALGALATEEHCAYLDMTTPWAEYIRSAKIHPQLFYRDVVHANEFGEQILAKIMMSFFAPAGGADSNPWPQHSLSPPVLLPDGTEFTTWEAPSLTFRRTFHVSASQPGASDANPGTKEQPFATINRAAQVLRPGDRVVVGPGLYRERIQPARGGTGPTEMISYEAEPEAQVILRGSRAFAGPWTRGQGANSNLWTAHLDGNMFDNYRPFALPNVTEEQFKSMDWAQPQRGKTPFTLMRGLVFQDGRRLTQTAEPEALTTNTGAYWVDVTNQVLHAKFFDNMAPDRALVEITTQETVFAPTQHGLGFIRVRGFIVEHTAGPFPWEQVGAISTTRGHHWIIEDCTVRQVSGVGLDLGIQHPGWPQPPFVGFHIVRRNIVTDCGICGICGLGRGAGREFGLLLEDNVVMRNAWQDAELLWETGGIKTHCNVRCLIRRNLVMDTRHGAGIWMDWDNRNSRCCQNIVVGSHTSNGGIFVEASTVANLVDQNIVWNTTGHGIYEHDSRRQIFAHNLVGGSTGEAFHLHGKITDRRVGGEPMSYGAHYVANNVLVDNGKPDEFRGDPSIVTNQITLNGGATFNTEMLTLKWTGQMPPFAPAFVAAVTHDFLGQPRPQPPRPGPFATFFSPEASRLLWWGALPNDTRGR